MARLDDPEHVRAQYATEEGLATRQAIYADARGVDPKAAAIELLLERAPDRVLEVGCGRGDVAERIAAHGVELTALDSSERMVELTRARGVDAVVGDAAALPFGDGEFDAVLAAWMLYHLPDLDAGLAELRRVLRPGGRLVAVTVGRDHLAEIWALADERLELSFDGDNGKAALRRHFAQVTRREVRGAVTLPDGAAVRRYVASGARAHAAERIPLNIGPLEAHSSVVIFTAE